MPRRNSVPESVSMETPQAKALQRRHELEELQRRVAEHPSMSAVTALDKVTRAEESERLRQATGVQGFGAVPERQWDRLSWEERDRMVATARAAREMAATAAAGAPVMIEAPGLVLSKELRATFGSGTPERFSKMLNERLLDTYRGLQRTSPGVFGDHYVVNSPGWIARKLTDLGGDLTVGNLVKHKVFGVNSTPWEHMSALERDLWREKGQLPLSSIYFYRGKAAAPTGRFRGATHWDRLTVGTPVGTDELNVTVGSRAVDPALLDRMTVGTRAASSSFTLVENPASEGPIMVRPRVGDYFGRPLAGGQIGGTGEPWVHQDAKGGDASGSETDAPETPVSEGAPVPEGGPRIVINPSTFRNEKDALCVAFNEAFRIVMEDMAFEPVAEPTERQRRFFADTAYANDETQLRRTILARICTFDTSVKDPTDEQLQEAVEFLDSVMEAGVPQNEWEQSAVQRIRDAVARTAEAGVLEEGPGQEPPEPSGASTEADEGGGATEEEIAAKRRQEAERQALLEAEQEKMALARDKADKEAARVQAQRNGVMPLDGREGRIDAQATTLSARQQRDMERYNRSSASDRRELTGQFAREYGLSGLVNMEAGGNLSEQEAQTVATERFEEQRKKLAERGVDGDAARDAALGKATDMTRGKMVDTTSFAALDPSRQRIEAGADRRAAQRTERFSGNVLSSLEQRASRNAWQAGAQAERAARDRRNEELFSDRRREIEEKRRARFARPDDEPA